MTNSSPSPSLKRSFHWLLYLVLAGAAPAWAQVDNYQFAASPGTFAPLPATATAEPALLGDDVISGVLPIGFTFVFDGTPYNSFVASSNGFISFNTAAFSNLSNDLSAGGTTERPLIAAFWDDLDGRDPTAAASYQTTGTAPNRTLTMEWLNWKRYGGTGPAVSFQVKLRETTNRVEMIYRPEASPLGVATASIGLAGVGTGSGSFLSLSDAVATPVASSTTSNDNISQLPPTGQLYTFTPLPPSPCPTPRTLAAIATSPTSVTLSWTVASGGGTFTVVYGIPGFNPATGGTRLAGISGSTITVNNLTAGTTYQFYVTQNCGNPNGNSNQAGPATFTTPPANDECTGAIPLTIGATCTPTTGTVAAATQSLAPSTTCGFATTARDVWYRFVAAGTSQSITVNAVSGAVMELFSGTCTSLGSQTCANLTGGTARSSLVGGLSAGQTYYLRLYSTQTVVSGNAASFTICVATAPTAPVNDDCTGAINVPIQYGTCVAQTTGDNTAATSSIGVPAPTCANYQGQDIWFKVTVPASGALTVQTDAPAAGSPITDTGMSVYSGTCSSLTQIQCDDDSSPNGNYSLIDLLGRTPGEILYIRVWAFGGFNSGLVAVCATSPSNCAVPTGPAASNVTDTGATLTWVGGTGGPSGTFEVEYGPQGFTLGTGTSVTGLTGTSYAVTGLTPASNYCFYVRMNCGSTNGSSAFVGPTCFTTPLSVPTNDEPCGAIPLGNGATGTTLGATTSSQNGINLPACSPAQSPKDVWFTFTATASTKNMLLSSTNAGMVRVYESPSCANGPFNQVFCQASTGNNLALGSVTVTGLTVGRAYYVAVSGYGSSSSLGSFTVLGARAQAETQAMVVYPNPSHVGQFTLRLDTDHLAGTAILFNALGQTVTKQQVLLHSAEQTFSTKGLTPGIYMLRVTLGEQVLTRKVVLE